MNKDLAAHSENKKSSDNPEEFFCTFFRENKNNLHGCGPLQTYPPDAVIFQQDAPANAVYLIEKGLVKLSQVQPDGRQHVSGIRSRCWLLGAPPVILDRQYMFTATTLISCELRSISAKCFLDLVKSDEIFSWQLNRLMSLQIYNGLERVEEVSCMSANHRMEKFLSRLILEMGIKVQKKMRLKLPLKINELAGIIAVTPEHLCRVLKNMEQQGLIKKTRGMLTFVDFERILNK
jgi:CRP-like cAMP-binding protein